MFCRNNFLHVKVLTQLYNEYIIHYDVSLCKSPRSQSVEEKSGVEVVNDSPITTCAIKKLLIILVNILFLLLSKN